MIRTPGPGLWLTRGFLVVTTAVTSPMLCVLFMSSEAAEWAVRHWRPNHYKNGLITKVLARAPVMGYLPPKLRGGFLRFLALTMFGITVACTAGLYEGLATVFVGDLVYAIDDWFFGDDDAWRRRWRAAKNTVRWLMELPAPVPHRGTT